MALIGAVDLGDDRQPAATRRGPIQLDHTPVLQPGVCIDPEVHLVSGKMPRQKRPRYLGLERSRRAVAAGKIDVPFRMDKVIHLLDKPGALLRQQAEIENSDRRIGALRANRQHQVLQQCEIAGVGGTDNDQIGCGLGLVHRTSRYPSGSVTRISARAGSRSILRRSR